MSLPLTCSFPLAQYKALHRSLEGTEGGGGGGEEREEEEEERITITFEDMLAALREVRPSAMREVTLEVPKVGRMLLSGDVSSHGAVPLLRGRCCGPTSEVRRR